MDFYWRAKLQKNIIFNIIKCISGGIIIYYNYKSLFRREERKIIGSLSNYLFNYLSQSIINKKKCKAIKI